MIKIGIISAMAEESANVKNIFGSPNEIYEIGKFKVNKYISGNAEIYHATSGVGEILAASATELLILKFNVDMIINFGLCGSVHGRKISDMVAVKGVVHYDFDTTALDGGSVGKYSQFCDAVIKTDEKCLALLADVWEDYDEVICASADKFVADENVKKWLYNTFNADICEMESAGILIASSMHSVPSLFIKVVSDADNHKEEFNAFLDRCDARFADVLKKLIDKLS
ncbi:MAG: 5'-methylthioadenosine/S-adenosylhomocysteine nucleosidase [Christensenellaceae bacterium]